MILPFLRIFLWQGKEKHSTLLCAIFQDLFIAAQLSYLPYSLQIPLFLYQWCGIVIAHRLEVRLTPSLCKHPRSFLDSAKQLRLLPWLFVPLIPLPSHPLFLLLGPLAALWSRRLEPSSELKASNPLFYFQWKWFIHPPLKQPAISSPPTSFPPIQTKPHILFLFLESFRADCTKYTPHFVRLAKKGRHYTQCSAAGQQTFQALLASLYGIQPSLSTLHIQPYLTHPLHGLPAILKAQGYKTSLIDGGYTTFDSNHLLNFDEVVGAETLGEDFSWGAHDEKLYNYTLQWLKKQTQPTLTALFTISNHHPWIAPPNWHFTPPSHLPEIKQKYLTTLAYADHCLGHFVDQLDLSNTLLFILGDHGQDLGEKKTHFTARPTLHQENIHVPLLLLTPNLKPAQIDTPCSQLDLFPTALDLLGLEADTLRPSLLEPKEAPLFFSIGTTPPKWGCRSGHWKWLSDGELYNLAADPTEQNNLASQFPEIFQSMKELSLHYFQTHQIKTSPQISHPTILDLGKPNRHTDQTFTKLLHSDLQQLVVPNSPFITDASLFAIARHCPHLTLLTIAGAPQLTYRGIETIFETCTNLKYLSLEGIDEMEHFRPTKAPKLRALFLSEQIVLEEENLLHLLSLTPHLTHLELNVSNLKTIDPIPTQLQQRTLHSSHHLKIKI